MGILAWLLLGAVAGYLAGRLDRRAERLGIVADVLLGIIGALAGGFMAAVLIPADPVSSVEVRSLVVAVLGAAIALIVWDATTRTPRTARTPRTGRRPV